MMTWNSIFFQNPSSSLMELITVMYDYLTLMLFSIMIMVISTSLNFFFSKDFMSYYLEDDNLEMIWTIFPMLVLIFIIIPSLESLYFLDTCIFCGLDINIMGHQWYWSYSYKDFMDCKFFDSYMLTGIESVSRLLDVDNRLILPSNTPVRLMVGSSDVIHSWALPSMGLKMDAVPGRMNQTCFTPLRSGIFFGQCSEICGANHSFMPIVLEIIPFKNFIKII